MTSVSQNDKIDAVSVLLVNLSLIKQIVAIYGYRPTHAKLLKIYASVLRNSLIAYGMQNVNWFNVFGKFFAGVSKKIPFIDTLVDSAVQEEWQMAVQLLLIYVGGTMFRCAGLTAGELFAPIIKNRKNSIRWKRKAWNLRTTRCVSLPHWRKKCAKKRARRRKE